MRRSVSLSVAFVGSFSICGADAPSKCARPVLHVIDKLVDIAANPAQIRVFRKNSKLLLDSFGHRIIVSIHPHNELITAQRQHLTQNCTDSSVHGVIVDREHFRITLHVVIQD